ncbi:alpha/beta hydrolase family protein [Bifidobacterium olomucense]|uniref:Cytochrome C n=1 Tax=Bifidobacterium olomucense TaxID=2675324 RepID=A0A7Y0EZG8_9BIFI|nr:alpha/beta fold hydrolase [Bifidobacterium sp. DSM 109959]NMM99249.1 cytochrome C [Bifidobacterium sp. DSM 109959]
MASNTDVNDVTCNVSHQRVPGNDAIANFPRRKARTLRFTCGAPRSAQVIGDGARALFLRSDGPEDLVTALWMSWFGADGEHHETKLADPRELLGEGADSEDVPAEERARRERAREGGTGIVGYSADKSGDRIVFTINGRLYITEIGERQADGSIIWPDVYAEAAADRGEPVARTREIAGAWLDDDPDTYAPVLNPRIAPDGTHILYTTGTSLMLVDIGDWPDDADVFDDRITAIYTVSVEDEDGNPAENTWKIGLAEFVAGEEMNRYDGFWWAPDSEHVLFESFDTADEQVWHLSDPANPLAPAAARRYPAALTRNADVYLTLATLAFDEDDRYAGITATADVQWDRDTYEYVAAVNWSEGHDPLLLVQDRCQRNDQVLKVMAGKRWFGTTRVLERHHNDQWIDLVPGTPAYTPDGRLVCALNDMDADTNRLTVDGRPFTPAGWNVREVLHVGDHDVMAVVQREPDVAGLPAAWSAAGGEHDARSFDVVLFDYDGRADGGAVPITTRPGVWTASHGERGMVVSGRDLDHAGVQMVHSYVPVPDAVDAAVDAEAPGQPQGYSAGIANHAAEPGFTPNLHFTRLGEHRLYTAIIAPGAESPYAHAEQLPVLMKPYGGPGFQQVVDAQSFYWEAQWWADQGFLVVTVDGRGTTGRGPKWDREIFENMKPITLADQIEAVHALPAAVAELDGVPAPDLDKVTMIGWSYGGFLSALAVLDAPDVFKAACAGAPPTDWTLYDTHYTERYLGLDPEVYARNGIIQDAPKLTRPLMLIHGFADDNVTIAHSLRLSQALMAAGRPHTFLPLTGITHMTNDETVAENLLIVQRDFLKEALALR